MLDGPWPFILEQRRSRMLGAAASSPALSQCAWDQEEHADNVAKSDVVSCYKINYKVVFMPSWVLVRACLFSTHQRKLCPPTN